MKDRTTRILACLALALAAISTVFALMAYDKAADSLEAVKQHTATSPTQAKKTAKSAPTPKPSKAKKTEDPALVASGDLPNEKTKGVIGTFEIALHSAGTGNVADCYRQMDAFRPGAVRLERNQQLYLANNNYPSNGISSNLLDRSHLYWICDTAKGHNVDLTDRSLFSETYEVRKDWISTTTTLNVNDVSACVNAMNKYRTDFNKLSPAGKIFIGNMSLPSYQKDLTDSSIYDACVKGAPSDA